MPRDLSEIHAPIGEQPKGLPLTAEQVAHFHKYGFVAGIRVLDDPQIETLHAALERLADPAHPGHDLFYEFHSNESKNPSTVLFHALGAWRIEEAFHDLLWNPAVLMAASQLFDGPVRFWHDQLFSKPAHHGGVVAWHQDYSYWTRTEPMQHLTCWIGLDDTTTSNGCLHYVPGSHHWPLLPITGLAGDMNEIRTVLTPQQLEQFAPVPVELKRGECSFHHPLLVHGSFENRTAGPRRAAVLNFFRDGVLSGSDDVLLDGVPVIPRGRKMEGQFFPLLFDPSAARI